tara:strand:- start:84 stop:1019 length:936 start_codon:yes stop_codon:yes gene_type:complete
LKGGGGTQPFKWSINSGELPPGLELLASGLIRGNPSKAGQYSFGLRLDDSQGGAASGFFELSFVDPLLINSEFISDFTVDSPVDLRLQGSGGLTPYKWEISAGEMPDGVDFDENGVFLGIPETAKNSEITVLLTDSSDLSVEKRFSLNIVEDLILTTQSIPAARNGENYLFNFSASGGTKPYSWALSDGFLPEGVNFSSNGEIVGIPQSVSSTQISVRVTDAAGRSASFPYIFGVYVGGERQTIVARGGSISIDIRENDIIYIENTPNDGFTGYLISPGPKKVQFHFIGNEGQIPSWIVCDLNFDEICSFE